MLFGWVSQILVSCNGHESYKERISFVSYASGEKLLVQCKNINCFHYFMYYLLNKMLICILKWYAGLLLRVLAHCFWCNVISWAKLLYMFPIDCHHLNWEYSTCKQHETDKSSTKERVEVFFENYFPLLNNILILTWRTQFSCFIVEELMINFREIIFILFLQKNFDIAKTY